MTRCPHPAHPSTARRCAARSAALALSVVLGAALLAACGGDDGDGGAGAAGGPTTEITLTDEGCEPAALQMNAGAHTFHITNEGAAGVTEFEILSGERIVAEVEGIAAGLDRTLDVRLDAGDYVTYCPGGEREKGTLTVTA